MRLDRSVLAQAALASGEVGPLEDSADLNLSNKELDDVSILVEETPLVENLNLAFNQLHRVSPLHKLTQLTRLNLSHNALLDVERLGSLKELNVLNLSKNKLTTVGSIVELQDLEELWLRDNQIAELSVLVHLAHCATLKRLVLKPNPVCRLFPELYYHLLVHHVPTLEVLDGKKVGDAEREAAAKYFSSAEGRKALRDAGMESRRGQRPPLPPIPPPEEADSRGKGVAIGFEEAMEKRQKEREDEGGKSAGRRERRESKGGEEGGEGRVLQKKGSTIWQRQQEKERAREREVVGDVKGLIHRDQRADTLHTETTQRYGRNGPLALILRADGTGEARYEAGQVAVSADGGRVTAMYRNGDVAVTADGRGNAMVCMASGTVVYSNIAGRGGRLQDVITGAVTREWGPEGEGGGGGGDVVNCRLGDSLGVRVKTVGGDVEVFFVCDSGRRGERIKHVFRQRGAGGGGGGGRAMQAAWDAGGPFGDGAAVTRETTAGAGAGPDVKSEEFRDDIRSAVENIVDFQALRDNLGSQEDVPLAPAEKKNPLLPQGSGKARRTAYAQMLKEQGRAGSWTAGSSAGSVGGRTRRGSSGGASVATNRSGGGGGVRGGGIGGGGDGGESARTKGSDAGEVDWALRRMRQEVGNALSDLPMEWEVGGGGEGERSQAPGKFGRRGGGGREGGGVLSVPAANAAAALPPRPKQGTVLRGGSARELGGGGEKKDGRGKKKEKVPEAEPDLPEEELTRLQAIREQMKNMVAALSLGYG